VLIGFPMWSLLNGDIGKPYPLREHCVHQPIPLRDEPHDRSADRDAWSVMTGISQLPSGSYFGPKGHVKVSEGKRRDSFVHGPAQPVALFLSRARAGPFPTGDL